MGEARRRKLAGTMPTKKKKRKSLRSCKGDFQTEGFIRIPGLRN